MKKKEAILGVAARLFSVRGFKDTHVSEISKVTGAAEGTVFYHFKSKEELFLAILKDLKDRIVEEFQNFIDTRRFKNGMDMMDGAVSFYLHLAGIMEEEFLLLHRHDAYELAQSNPVCREYLEALYNCLVDIFERAIVLGQGDGSIGDVPPRKVAMIIFAMVDALVRLNTYNLYDAGTLYDELIKACHRILGDPKTSD